MSALLQPGSEYGSIGEAAAAKAPEPELQWTPITGARYTSADFARREWDGVFSRVWMVAGLANDIPEPGDYLTCDIGRESLLFVRGEDHTVRAFYNVCQHRGNRLVESELGSVAAFSCAYHNWKYDLKGNVTWVQDPEDYPRGSPCGRIQLRAVACEVSLGLIWYNLDPQCPPLASFLEPIGEQLRPFGIDELVRVENLTVELPCNWKIVIENFLEAYHTRTVHPQLRETVDDRWEHTQYDLYPGGHSRMILLGCAPGPTYQDPLEVPDSVQAMLKKWGLNPDDFRGRHSQIRRALQLQKRLRATELGKNLTNLSDPQLTDNFLYDLFPNMALSVYPEGEFMWVLRPRPHPTDPEKCLFDFWTLAKFPPGSDELVWEHIGLTIRRSDVVPHHTFKLGDRPIAPGVDQDMTVVASMQQGVRSRGFDGVYLCRQERRIQFLHENIDRYIDADPGHADPGHAIPGCASPGGDASL